MRGHRWSDVIGRVFELFLRAFWIPGLQRDQTQANPRVNAGSSGLELLVSAVIRSATAYWPVTTSNQPGSQTDYTMFGSGGG
jgi:hypothetical protein